MFDANLAQVQLLREQLRKIANIAIQDNPPLAPPNTAAAFMLTGAEILGSGMSREGVADAFRSFADQLARGEYERKDLN